MTDKLLGSIEAGGTKFVLAVADMDFNEVDRMRIETTTPEETLAACIDYFRRFDLAALGVGSFGPIDMTLDSPTYGRILSTPKPHWAQADVVGPLAAALHVPIAFTTDVNASAYGEYAAGRAKDDHSVVYITIGTGIGGGVIQDGHFVGGISHLEMGHAVAARHPDDTYEGGCPFHGGRCFEGLAAGPTIQARTGTPGEELPRDAQVFTFIRYYAAQLAFNAFVNYRPAKIVFGGSVLDDADMPLVRQEFSHFNQGYVETPDLNTLIQTPGIPDNGSATLGDFAMAKALIEGRG